MGNLSKILTGLMSELQINATALAKKTGIGQPVIYRLMTGRTENPQIFTLKPIADFFQITIDQLLGFIPLHQEFRLNQATLCEINNKFTSIKTVAITLVDFLPILIEGYKCALSAKLIEQSLPTELIPLLKINATNMIKSINYIQENLSAQDINH